MTRMTESRRTHRLPRGQNSKSRQKPLSATKTNKSRRAHRRQPNVIRIGTHCHEQTPLNRKEGSVELETPEEAARRRSTPIVTSSRRRTGRKTQSYRRTPEGVKGGRSPAARNRRRTGKRRVRKVRTRRKKGHRLQLPGHQPQSRESGSPVHAVVDDRGASPCRVSQASSPSSPESSSPLPAPGTAQPPCRPQLRSRGTPPPNQAKPSAVYDVETVSS